MYSIFYIDVGIYIFSGIPCIIILLLLRSWPAEARWDPWWNRWDPRRDFTQDWRDPDQDYGLPQVGSRLGSHPRLVGSQVGPHPRHSIIPVSPGIPPGIKTGSRVGLAESRLTFLPGYSWTIRKRKILLVLIYTP